MLLVRGVTPFCIKSTNTLTSLCSYYFDDNNNEITLGSQLNAVMEGAATFSMKTVFRLMDLTSNQWIFSNSLGAGNQSIRFQWFQSTTQLRVWFSSDGTATTVIEIDANLNDTNWHQFGITYDEGTVTLNLDGVDYSYTEITGSPPVTLHTTGSAPVLGQNGFSSAYFEGYVNQMQFTSDIILEAEYATAWGGGTPVVGAGALDNIVADYIFDNDTFNGTNWVVVDRSGNGNGLSSGITAVQRDCNENPY